MLSALSSVSINALSYRISRARPKQKLADENAQNITYARNKQLIFANTRKSYEVPLSKYKKSQTARNFSLIKMERKLFPI